MRTMDETRYNSVIVRFGGEIGIKSPPVRLKYEGAVCKQIMRVLKHYQLPFEDVIHVYGRAYVLTTDAERVAERLTKIFGISSVSPAIRTTSNLQDIIELSVRVAGLAFGEGSRFAVRCRRVGRQAYTSMDVCRAVGQAILDSLADRALSVDLERPDHTLSIEVREDMAYVYLHTYEGPGGYPLGSQSRAVCLLSGGMDSPVACWLVMRRGCPIIPVYLDNTPYTDERAREKAIDTAKVLFEWAVGFPKRIYIVPHGQNLKEIKEKCPENLTCILCKRLMYRIAERIADRENAEGIVTGEAIGEQASQTLSNLRILSQAVKNYPIHRPLLGLEKTEIEELARKIGTYEISARPAKNCTAAPKRPATRTNLKRVLEAEDKLDVDAMVDRSVRNAEILDLEHA